MKRKPGFNLAHESGNRQGMNKHRKETALANMQIAHRRAKKLGHELSNFRWESQWRHYESNCKMCGAYVYVTKGPVDDFTESAITIKGTAVKGWRTVRDSVASGGFKKIRDFCPGVAWRRKERKEWRAEVATLRRIFKKNGIAGVIAHVAGPYPMT